MNPTYRRRRLSGLCAVTLSLTLTGCPLLDPPEPLKPLLIEKEEKLAFKVDKEKNSACRITKDFEYGRYIYDHRGRLCQYVRSQYPRPDGTVTFHYDEQDYLIAQDFSGIIAGISKIRWNYLYDGGLISRIDRYVETNGRMVLADQVLFESGKRKIYSVISEGGRFEIVFNTDNSGRVTGFTTNAESPTGEMISYFLEYDSRGNWVKSYTNSSDPVVSETRFSNIPNPIYHALQFKGHSQAKHITYFDGSLYSLGNPSPDLPVYDKTSTSSWTTINEYGYGDLNAAGYPVSREFLATQIVRKADYESCN